VLQLYAIPFSTNVERVRLALGHKQIEAQIVGVPVDDRSLVERVSGQPLVPVLVDGDEVIADSLAILRHLERRQPEPPLFPRDERRGAEVDLFLAWFDRVWKVAPNAIEAELGTAVPEAARLDALALELSDHLALFECLLAGRDYLFGDFGAADCAAFPFLRYALGCDPADTELFHRILADHQPLGDSHPRIADWIGRVDARPRGG
jgi:glutathione S-transferase